ncbi:MAG: DUF4780 domain-containing protein [Sphingobacteriaceae bacterium]|nr:MAG: DUF4780 domain-containing protein [Sphingobacteriaceae bacterium]
MENRGNMSSSPATSTPMSNNRGRQTPGSASMDQQPMKRANINTSSYAEVLSKANLLVAVIDLAEGNVLKMIEEHQYFKFLEIMNEMHYQTVKSGCKGGFIPSFEENRNVRQGIKIKCSNSASRRWLEEFVPNISQDDLWDGANLTVTDFSKLPKPITVNVWFPGTKRSDVDILCMLQTLNTGLNCSNWSVMRRKTTNKGTSLRLGICQASKDFINAKRNRLFFGITQAICYFKKERKAVLEQNKDVDEENLLSETEAETEDDTASESNEKTMIAHRSNGHN